MWAMTTDSKIELTMAAAIALGSALICILIEVLNARAGGYLPRRDISEEGNNKWRVAPGPKGQAESEFRDFVSTWGLAQYLIAPGGLAMGVFVAMGRRDARAHRVVGIAAGLVSAACVAMMLYRGYFSSLGW